MRKIGLVFAGLLLLRVSSGPTADLAYILLIFYALYSRAHAIEALFLSFVFTHINTTIFPSASLAAIYGYFIVFAAFNSVIWRDVLSGRFVLNNLSFILVVFTLFIWVHSFFFSAVPVISILKVTIWCVTFFTILQAWRTIDDASRARIELRIFGTLAVIVVASMIMKGYPGAYLPSTELLRGLLNHSQALGVVSAIVAVWSFMWAIESPRPSLLALTIFSLSALTILNTGTRTALLSVVLTVFFVVTLTVLKFGRLSFKSIPGSRSKRFVFFALLGGGALILQVEAIKGFLLKGKEAAVDQSVDLAELYNQSRGGLISQMWANIASDPFFGIGFGIPSIPEEIYINYFAGIPISAPVEKGVTLLAVWEELGVVGLVLFLILVLAIFRRGIMSGSKRSAIFVTLLLLNMGEATLLSAGGIGMVQLVLFGWITSESHEAPAQFARCAPTPHLQTRTRPLNAYKRSTRR